MWVERVTHSQEPRGGASDHLYADSAASSKAFRHPTTKQEKNNTTICNNINRQHPHLYKQWPISVGARDFCLMAKQAEQRRGPRLCGSSAS
mmetsp:Transcript_27672/g.49149  ORF Transcript_27672/g.49149 Transcript_27672/m.49149 type:complete len:91 (+) Transcript_27672:1644-1916(+)